MYVLYSHTHLTHILDKYEYIYLLYICEYMFIKYFYISFSMDPLSMTWMDAFHFQDSADAARFGASASSSVSFMAAPRTSKGHIQNEKQIMMKSDIKIY